MTPITTILSSYRRALTTGAVVGITLIFLILIGLPGGSSDTDGLPAWFVWGAFMVVTAGFAWQVARPRNFAEERAQTPLKVLINGTLVGVIAAGFVVFAASALNAFQVWELAQPIGGVPLASGLTNKIARVQDVFGNVQPRTTAVLSGGETDAYRITAGSGKVRPDPFIGFFTMAALLPIAGILGGVAYLASRQAQALGQGRKEIGKRQWVGWLSAFAPLIPLSFVILLGQNPTVKEFFGNNAQLAGLVASFFVIGLGLIGIRGAAADSALSSLTLRLALTLPVTIILFGLALNAPSRPIKDLLYTPRPPNAMQVRGEDGKDRVVITPASTLTQEELLNYRTLTLIGLASLFIAANLWAARGKISLRGLVATNVLLGSMFVAPLFLDTYQQSVLLLIGINVLAGLGLNIVVGYAGLLDLGYVAFFAIGAYMYAFLSSNQDIRQGGQIVSLKFAGNDQTVQRTAASLIIGLIITAIIVGVGVYNSRRVLSRLSNDTKTQAKPVTTPPWWYGTLLVGASVGLTLLVIHLLIGTDLYASFAGFPVFIVGLLVGMMFASFAGIMLGIPVLRLRGDYLAIVTLGFGEIIRLFLNNVKDVTGGPAGLLTIPKLEVGAVEIGSNEGLLYVVLIACLFLAMVSLRLRSSRLGRAWGALRSDEDIAQAMGINLVNTKVLAFAIGAGFAGLGGVLFATRQANIFPDNFTLQRSIDILALVIIGGMGSVPGVVIGALVLIGIPESLRVFEVYRYLAFGGLLVAMMLLRPGGLLPQPPQALEDRAASLRSEKKEMERRA
jgi:ABC-type branched-subunit amino acid transport system permease subunit